jgi:hypothetical protein
MTIDGYATLEQNRVAFNNTGRVIADLPLAAGFNTAAPAENGMLLCVDYAAGEVKLPDGSDAIVALHCSPEKEYDPALTGLKNFKLVAASATTYTTRNQVFYPRLGLLSIGDRFTTNCISYNTDTFADNAALLAAIDAVGTTPLFGYATTNGGILVTTAAPNAETLVLQVVKKTTIPNGDLGLKFVVLKA